jgi:hypothetical protein
MISPFKPEAKPLRDRDFFRSDKPASFETCSFETYLLSLAEDSDSLAHRNAAPGGSPAVSSLTLPV